MTASGLSGVASPATLYTTVESPLGTVLLSGDADALSSLYFVDGSRSTITISDDWRADHGAFARARAELAAYFAGELTSFTIPLAPRGTAFQQRVWTCLLTVPYGVTTTYGTIAADLGDPRATRAVGLANGRNPISIIIPCHRVIGASGDLTGYGGGMHRKRWLLAHEGRLPLPLPWEMESTESR